MSTDDEKPGMSDLERLEEEYRDVPSQRRSIGRGPQVLRAHLEKAAQRKQQVTIRLDADIVSRFKLLAGPDGSYQSLMNRALHEWLEARSVSGLLQEKLAEMQELIESLREVKESSQQVAIVDRDPSLGGPVRVFETFH